MTLTQETELLLGRSLDDDQESRRSLLDSASASDPVRFGNIASHHGIDPEAAARLLLERISASLGSLATSPDLNFANLGQKRLTQMIQDCFRLSQSVSSPPTLREHLLSLSGVERRQIVESFVQDARVSCAYEDIALDPAGLADQLEAEIHSKVPPAR